MQNGASTSNGRMARIDLALALVLIVLAVGLMVWIIPAFVRTPTPPRPLAMAPWALPQASAAILGIAALVMAVLAARGQTTGEPAAPPDWRAIPLPLAALAVFVWAMPVLGALLTGMIVTFAMIAVRPGQPLWRAALIGVVVPGLTWAMFTELAGTPLPEGLWGIG